MLIIVTSLKCSHRFELFHYSIGSYLTGNVVANVNISDYMVIAKKSKCI